MIKEIKIKMTFFYETCFRFMLLKLQHAVFAVSLHKKIEQEAQLMLTTGSTRL